MKIKTNRKGFTVVELVIVIAVIGILSAILIPTFSGLITKANRTNTISTVNNTYTSYAIDVNAEDLLAKGSVYISNAEDVTAEDAVIWMFDGTEWREVVAADNLDATDLEVAIANAYNGYKVYKLAA